jgi:glutamine amidotransferase
MITIVDYKMGNVGSIANMLKRTGHESLITSKVSDIEKASMIVLPGVGSFDKAIENLDTLKLIEILNKKALIEKTPVLGICLGMQLMAKDSEEGKLQGLGWFDAYVVHFKVKNHKVPHMGWNTVKIAKPDKIFSDVKAEQRFYFVHSYHMQCLNKEAILTTTEYEYEFTSAITKDNITGVQFHPEKSHKYGMQLLKNWVNKSI